MAEKTRPILGALGDALMYGAQAIPAQQTQNATLTQRYAEFQEQKNQAGRTAQATADYRQNMLNIDRAQLGETRRHNLAIESAPVPEKPLTKTEVEGMYLGKHLEQLQREGRLGEYFGGKSGGDKMKSSGVTTKAVGEYLNSRKYRNQYGEVVNPPFTEGTMDTVRALEENLTLPSNPVASDKWNSSQIRPMLGGQKSVDYDAWGRQNYSDWDELTETEKAMLIKADYR